MLGSILAEQWLYATLAGEPTVAAVFGAAVHKWPAPADAADRRIVFQREGARDVGPIGGPVTAQLLRYRVKAQCPGESTGPIEAGAQAMDTALDGARESLAGGWGLTCDRTGELPVPAPPEDGIPVQELGGIYEIFVGSGG